MIGIFGISKTTLYRIASSGEVPAVKAGGEWRFARQTLVNWVAVGGRANQLDLLLRNARSDQIREGDANIYGGLRTCAAIVAWAAGAHPIRVFSIGGIDS